MGRRNKKWKKNKNKNKYKRILYVDTNIKANSDQVNNIAYQVFGSLYYTSDNS
jgi:hypothetical protein